MSRLVVPAVRGCWVSAKFRYGGVERDGVSVLVLDLPVAGVEPRRRDSAFELDVPTSVVDRRLRADLPARWKPVEVLEADETHTHGRDRESFDVVVDQVSVVAGTVELEEVDDDELQDVRGHPDAPIEELEVTDCHVVAVRVRVRIASDLELVVECADRQAKPVVLWTSCVDLAHVVQIWMQVQLSHQAFAWAGLHARTLETVVERGDEARLVFHAVLRADDHLRFDHHFDLHLLDDGLGHDRFDDLGGAGDLHLFLGADHHGVGGACAQNGHDACQDGGLTERAVHVSLQGFWNCGMQRLSIATSIEMKMDRRRAPR